MQDIWIIIYMHDAMFCKLSIYCEYYKLYSRVYMGKALKTFAAIRGGSFRNQISFNFLVFELLHFIIFLVVIFKNN